MDLVRGAKKVVVLMDHVSRDGTHKIVQECSLPLTGKHVVERIITDLCIMDVTDDGLVLCELADGVTEDDIRSATESGFTIDDLRRPQDERNGEPDSFHLTVARRSIQHSSWLLAGP